MSTETTCRTCNRLRECRTRIGGEYICDGCLNIYNVIRTLVIKTMPSGRLPSHMGLGHD